MADSVHRCDSINLSKSSIFAMFELTLKCTHVIASPMRHITQIRAAEDSYSHTRILILFEFHLIRAKLIEILCEKYRIDDSLKRQLDSFFMGEGNSDEKSENTAAPSTIDVCAYACVRGPVCVPVHSTQWIMLKRRGFCCCSIWTALKSGSMRNNIPCASTFLHSYRK